MWYVFVYRSKLDRRPCHVTVIGEKACYYIGYGPVTRHAHPSWQNLTEKNTFWSTMTGIWAVKLTLRGMSRCHVFRNLGHRSNLLRYTCLSLGLVCILYFLPLENVAEESLCGWQKFRAFTLICSFAWHCSRWQTTHTCSLMILGCCHGRHFRRFGILSKTPMPCRIAHTYQRSLNHSCKHAIFML